VCTKKGGMIVELIVMSISVG